MRRDEVETWEKDIRAELSQVEDEIPALEEEVAIETLKSVMRRSHYRRDAEARLERAQLRAETLRTALKGIEVLRRDGKLVEREPERVPEMPLKEWLQRTLPQEVGDLQRLVGQAGYSWPEVCALREELGVVVKFPAGKYGTCYWTLPEPEDRNDWLRDQLKNGEVAVAELQERAKAAGYGWRSIERAKSELGVTAVRRGGSEGAWFWRLPTQEAYVDA